MLICCHAHLLSSVLVKLRDSTGDCQMTQYDLDLLRLTFQLIQSVEQLGNLSDVELSTLFSWVRLY